MAWAADNQTLFYTVEDAAKRPYRLYRHRLGDGGRTRSSTRRRTSCSASAWAARAAAQYLLLGVRAATPPPSGACLPADDPAGEWRMVAPREHEHEYDVDHHGDSFYIRTNDTRPQLPPREGPGRRARAARAGRRSCRTARDVMLEGIELLPQPPTCCSSASAGSPQLRVTDLAHRRRRTASTVPRAGLLGLPGRQRGVRHHAAPLSATSRW